MTPGLTRRPVSFPPVLGTVVRTRVRIGLRRIGAARARHPIRTTIQGLTLVVAGLMVAASIALLSRSLFTAVPAADQHLIVAAALAALLSAGFIASSSAALQSIYLASDLPFLLTLPIPLIVTFSSKFVETLAGTLPIGFIGFWFITGYATTSARPLLTLAIGSTVLVAYLVVLTALGIVMVAGIARVVPAKRAWTVLGILSLSIVALLGVWWATIERAGTSTPIANVEIDETVQFGTASLVANLLLAGAQVEQTPLAWAGRVIAGTDGPAAVIWWNGSLFAALAIVSTGVAWWLFAITFSTGTSGFRAASAPAPRPSRPIARWTGVALSYLPGHLATLVLKEWITMFRDSRRLTGALWPLGSILVYTINLSRGAPDMTDPAGWGFWQSIGPVILLPWAASLGTAAYVVGSEHRGIHLLRALPIDGQLLLGAKVIAGIVPVFTLTTVAAILVAVSNGATPVQLGIVVLCMVWSSVGFVTLDTCASALAPNFLTDQVQRSLRLKGRIYSLFAGAVFAVGTALVVTWVIIALEGQPAAIRDLEIPSLAGFDPLGWPLALAGVAIGGGIIVTSWKIGVRRLDWVLSGES